MAPRTPMMMLNPAVLEDEEIQDQVRAQCCDLQTLYSVLPPEGGVIPEDGAWIIVRDVPHTALEFDVPLYSIWRARRYVRTRQFKVGGRGTDYPVRKVQWPMMLAEIQTPGGDLVLYPTEYTVTDLSRWIDLIGEGVTVNFMGAGEPGDLEQQLFYLRAHGVRRPDALLALLPELKDERFIYLTLDVVG